MLQFATCDSPVFSTAGQVEKVLEGGCKWIRLTGPQTAESVEALMPSCREAEAILVLDNDTDLVDRLRIHGLHLTAWTRGEVIAAREKLGPHAIIGVDCDDISRLPGLKGLDVDYVVVKAPADKNISDNDLLEFYASVARKIKTENIDLHPVASGNFTPGILPSLLATGIEGVEMSHEIIDAPDPAAFVRELLEILKN